MIDDFVKKAFKMATKVDQLTIVYILHPLRIAKAVFYRDFFQKLGFRFIYVGFDGVWKGKKYPESYSLEEKKFIGESAPYWLNRLQLEMPNRNFKGIPCLAGFSSFFVNPAGIIQRCMWDQTPLQEPLKKAEPCGTNRVCGCGLLLEEVNTHTPIFWQYHRKTAGLSFILTNPKTDDELYTENKNKFYDVMIRYGKDPLHKE
jgi:hypothetical protein